MVYYSDLRRRAPRQGKSLFLWGEKLFTIGGSYSQSLDTEANVCYIITMETESIYKVTLAKGPQTSIMPIKARDEAHAVRIAQNMDLGLVVKVEFACEDTFN